MERHVKFIWRPKSEESDLNSAFGELDNWNNGMLIRIDRSSFAFANQLKSEKFNENLTDVRTDFQPIEKTKKELIW